MEYGISGYQSDYRFVKKGNSIIGNIRSYMLPSGGFSHSKKEMKENLMATEQAFYALVAAKRYYQGKNHFMIC